MNTDDILNSKFISSSYKHIIDLGSEDNLYIINTGQSGNIFSTYYHNWLHTWTKGEYLNVNFKEFKKEKIIQLK